MSKFDVLYKDCSKKVKVNNMEKKDDISIEILTRKIAKFIKDRKKLIKNDEYNNYKLVPIYHSDWGCTDKDRVWHWTNSEIKFDGNDFKFYLTHIDDKKMCEIIESAVKESGCNCKVTYSVYDECKGRFPHNWYEQHKRFSEMIVLGKPCKEFTMLSRLIKRYSGKEIGETDLYYANICGKRTANYTESDKNYLCFRSKSCQRGIDFIRTKRKTRDVFTAEIKEDIDRGEDYEYACRAETEWYGSKTKYIELKVTTPSGKEKGVIKIY